MLFLQLYEVASLTQGKSAPASPFGDASTEAASPVQPHTDNLADNAPLSQRKSLRADMLDQTIATGMLGKVNREGKLEVAFYER